MLVCSLLKRVTHAYSRSLSVNAEGIFGTTLPLLERALTVRSAKHNVMVSNIANIDTPNYKAFDVVVREEMAKADSGARGGITVQRTHAAHLPAASTRMMIAPQAMNSDQTATRCDGNTVDLDRSMASLAENTILYTALAQVAARKFEGMLSAIQEGK